MEHNKLFLFCFIFIFVLLCTNLNKLLNNDVFCTNKPPNVPIYLYKKFFVFCLHFGNFCNFVYKFSSKSFKYSIFLTQKWRHKQNHGFP